MGERKCGGCGWRGHAMYCRDYHEMHAACPDCGEYMDGLLGRRATIAERVRFGSRVDPATGCMIWQGGTSGDGRGGGYPRMSLNGATVAVHRAAWVNAHGIIPPRKQLDHLCCNPLCVNPDHLELVTPRENARRRSAANNEAEI